MGSIISKVLLYNQDHEKERTTLYNNSMEIAVDLY